MTLSATIEQVIQLARAIRDYWETELPKRHPAYPIVQPGADDGPPPPEEGRLRKTLQSLTDDDFWKLITLSRLSWGDFDSSQLAQRFEAVRAEFDDRQWSIDYLLGRLTLADDLSDGMALLRSSNLNADRLLRTTKSER